MTGVTAGWNDFFVAQAGASASLVGLLFVAVSINLQQILEFPHLPTRVIEGMISLLSVLIVSTFALVPGQTLWIHGIEIGGTGLAIWTVKTTALLRTRGSGTRSPRPLLRVFSNQLPPLPFIAAGVLLVAEHPAGLYWVVPGTLLSFAAGIVDVWVLLIEIKR